VFPRFVILLTAVALAVGVYARPSGSAGKRETYVVKPADTLWSIACAHYSGDPRDAVWRLEHRNHLHGTTLAPGQRLVLP
jgi:nucleoid-associated protein YgaU